MKREDLVDNLLASHERGELVTLTVSPVAGRGDREVMTGHVVVPVAHHWTSRSSEQCVFLPRGRGLPLVFGIGMIVDFWVGPARLGGKHEWFYPGRGGRPGRPATVTRQCRGCDLWENALTRAHPCGVPLPD